jgi:hypothetical protein
MPTTTVRCLVSPLRRSIFARLALRALAHHFEYPLQALYMVFCLVAMLFENGLEILIPPPSPSSAAS